MVKGKKIIAIVMVFTFVIGNCFMYPKREAEALAPLVAAAIEAILWSAGAYAGDALCQKWLARGVGAGTVNGQNFSGMGWETVRTFENGSVEYQTFMNGKFSGGTVPYPSGVKRIHMVKRFVAANALGLVASLLGRLIINTLWYDDEKPEGWHGGNYQGQVSVSGTGNQYSSSLFNFVDIAPGQTRWLKLVITTDQTQINLKNTFVNEIAGASSNEETLYNFVNAETRTFYVKIEKLSETNVKISTASSLLGYTSNSVQFMDEYINAYGYGIRSYKSGAGYHSYTVSYNTYDENGNLINSGLTGPLDVSETDNTPLSNAVNSTGNNDIAILEPNNPLDIPPGQGPIVIADGPPVIVPDAPTNLQAKEVYDKGFTLDWDPAPNAQYYNVYKNGVLIANHITTDEYSITGLEADTSYNMGVEAANSVGTSSPTVLQVNTGQNPAPGGEASSNGLDLTPLKNVGVAFTNKFPFSLPWDILRLVQCLRQDQELPNLTLQFYMPLDNEPTTFTMVWPDFMPMVASWIRSFCLIMTGIGLVYSTRKLMGGGQ